MSRSSDIATRIDAHLRVMEADPVLNAVREMSRLHLRPYYQAGAIACGGRVRVTYVNFQGGMSIPLGDAEAYLAWLDAGNRGTHFEWERSR